SLNPNSSQAHAFIGNFMGQLIVHSFGGLLRYRTRSSQELDMAIQLDPNNATAYIWRGAGYLLAPVLMGGSPAKALAMFQKALALDPGSDTAHLWLAQYYQKAGQHADAMREIEIARHLDPDRRLTLSVYQTIAAN